MDSNQVDVITNTIQSTYQAYARSNTNSLADFIKPSLIESPCFLEDSLAEEPIVNDVIKNLYNIYIGYILISLQMNENVSGNRNVRDLISTVATTESFIDHQFLINGLGGCMTAALESHAPDEKTRLKEREEDRAHKVSDRHEDREHSLYEKELTGRHRLAEKELEGQLKYHERNEQREHDRTMKHEERVEKFIDSRTTTGSVSAQHFSEKNPQAISSGRQLEVSFATADGRDIKVMLHVKFNTRLIPEKVVEYILDQDFTLSLYNRWLQMRSGEIRFFKDFIFGIDKVNRQAKAMKHDKDHALHDLLKHKSGSAFKHMRNFGSEFAGGKAPRSYNIANSILILDEATVNRHTKRTGFSFSKLADRNRFFAKTYNLFIVLIDTRYSRVTIYTNGIDQSASYSFGEMKSSATSDKMSLKEVMEYMSKAQMPKF